MELCWSDHEEVCFEGKDCPACAVIEEKDSEIDDLEKQLKDAKDEIDDLSDQINNAGE